MNLSGVRRKRIVVVSPERVIDNYKKVVANLKKLKDDNDVVAKGEISALEAMFQDKSDKDIALIDQLQETVTSLTEKLTRASQFELEYNPQTDSVTLNGATVQMSWEEILTTVKVISVINPEATVILKIEGTVETGEGAVTKIKELQSTGSEPGKPKDSKVKDSFKEGDKVMVASTRVCGEVVKVLPTGSLEVKEEGSDTWGGSTAVFKPEELKPYKVKDETGVMYSPGEIQHILETAIESADWTFITLDMVPAEIRPAVEILKEEGGFFGNHDDLYELLKEYVNKNNLIVPDLALIKDSILVTPTHLQKICDSMEFKTPPIIGTPSKVVVTKSKLQLDNVIKLNDEVTLTY